MKKRYIDQFAQTDSTDEEQEAALRTLVQARLNEENREKWAAQLKEKGVVRQLQPKRNLSKYLVAAAAVVLLLAAIGVWRWQQTLNPAALAYQYIQEDKPIQLPSGFRGGNASDTRREAAVRAFNAKDYTSAIQQMNAINAADTTLTVDIIVKGMSYFYTRDYSNTIQLLSPLESEGNTLGVQIDWFLALAFIQSNNTAQAKPLLQRLSNDSDTVYAKRAKALLDQMME